MLGAGLEEVENVYDRRLIVNRARRVTMQRCAMEENRLQCTENRKVGLDSKLRDSLPKEKKEKKEEGCLLCFVGLNSCLSVKRTCMI